MTLGREGSYNLVTDVRPLTGQERVQKYGEFLDNPALERPTEADPRYRHIPDQQRRREVVATDQARWDNAAAYRKQLADTVAENRAKRDAAEEAERKAREEARQASRQEARAELEARLKRDFLEVPGALESDWTPEVRDRLVTEHLLRQAGAGDEQARADMARRLRTSF